MGTTIFKKHCLLKETKLVYLSMSKMSYDMRVNGTHADCSLVIQSCKISPEMLQINGIMGS